MTGHRSGQCSHLEAMKGYQVPGEGEEKEGGEGRERARERVGRGQEGENVCIANMSSGIHYFQRCLLLISSFASGLEVRAQQTRCLLCPQLIWL